MNPKLKSFIQYSIIILIGVVSLYYVYSGTDWSDLWDKIIHTNYFWITIGMLISLLSHFLRGYRAVMLYDALNYKVSVKYSFYAVMIGYMMNTLIPRSGEVSRCASLVKTNDVPIEKSLGTVVTERIFDMLILILILAFVFFMQFDVLTKYIQNSNSSSVQSTSSGINLKLILILASVVVVGIFFLVRKKLADNPLFKKVVDLVKGFGEGLMSVRQVKNPMLFIFLTVSIWACYILMMYFCLFAMKSTENLGFMQCLTVFAIGAIGVVIPAPGGGTYVAAIIQSLLFYGVAKEDGRAYATVVQGIQMMLLLVVGAICSYLVLAMHKKKIA